jgi:hypothetical protein
MIEKGPLTTLPGCYAFAKVGQSNAGRERSVNAGGPSKNSGLVKNEKGQRDPLHLWLSEDVGDPMLAQHLYTLMMFQRLAIANGHGWNRFLHTVDQVLPRRGDTIPLPLEMPPSSEDDEAAN